MARKPSVILNSTNKKDLKQRLSWMVKERNAAIKEFEKTQKEHLKNISQYDKDIEALNLLIAQQN